MKNSKMRIAVYNLQCTVSKLCPAVVLSLQDGCHSAVALLLKAALIQVSDYRLLGASGLMYFLLRTMNYNSVLM
jgi:hypothetical protein